MNCQCCELKPAVIRIVATNADCEVVDSTELCLTCAKDAFDPCLSFGSSSQLRPLEGKS